MHLKRLNASENIFKKNRNNNKKIKKIRKVSNAFVFKTLESKLHRTTTAVTAARL